MSKPQPLPPKRLSIRQKVLLGFGFVLAMLGVIAILVWRSTWAFQEAARQVAASRETLEKGEQMMRHLMELETARRTFLITGKDTVLREYEQAYATAFERFAELKVLTAQEPAQSVRIDTLKLLVDRMVTIEKIEIEARQKGGLAAAAPLFTGSKTDDILREVQSVFFDFAHTERVQQTESSERVELIGDATKVATLAGMAVTLVALSIAASLILRDIRRRLKAEDVVAEQAHLLANIMDAMPENVFVKDTAGRFIMHNRAHRLYLGLRSNESIVGKSVFDLFPQDLAERYHADDVYVVETGAPVRHREEPARPTSPNILWLSTTKVPLRDPSGRVIGVVCVSVDITQRKAADEKLKRFAEQLEASNTALQSFASVASHDLQEPLRKIQAFGDRLMARCGEQLGEQGRDYLGRMQGAAGRMQVLIQDLLKLSRVTSRAQPFERCDLAQIVAAVLSDLEIAIEDKQGRVEVDPLPSIDADALQMRQLFQNLIANALKFQKPGEPPHVEVRCETFIADGHEIPGISRGSGLCRITVRDHGIGFDQQFADQIFIVFQRLHTREEYEGTGIGLAVCRKITDRHGGTIVAKSIAGEGASFIVTLPIKQPKPPAHE